MDYIVAKTFARDGKFYRAGDAPPPDLDQATTLHYLRHGMLALPKAKPARTRRAAAPAPDLAPPADQDRDPATLTED